MAKGRYKMRTIVRWFRNERNVQKVEMDCGHIKTDPELFYGNETAFRINQLGHLFSGTPTKTRCYECAKKDRDEKR